MIGYHYTTQEAWEHIKFKGLQTAPLRQCDYNSFLNQIPSLPKDAIWVWQEELTDVQAFITLITLAELHDSFDIVLLRVEYGESSAASIICKEKCDESITLTCSFSAGRLETGKLPIELILDDVPASSIIKLWEVDLLASLRDRHAVGNELVLV